MASQAENASAYACTDRQTSCSLPLTSLTRTWPPLTVAAYMSSQSVRTTTIWNEMKQWTHLIHTSTESSVIWHQWLSGYRKVRGLVNNSTAGTRNFVPYIKLSARLLKRLWKILAIFYGHDLIIVWTLFSLVKESYPQNTDNKQIYIYMYIYTYTHGRADLKALCTWLPGWAGTRKVKPIWILLKQQMSGSGINWAIYKSALCSRQITTPVPQHSLFYRPDALPATQQTASKHWRQI